MRYIVHHRLYTIEEKKKKLTSDMMSMAKKHPPGERSEELLLAMADWAKEAGPEIFKQLKKNELHDVCQELSCKSFSTNHILFLQGQRGDTFWIIIRGQIKIFVEDDSHVVQVKMRNMSDQGEVWMDEKMSKDDKWLGREVAKINGGGFGELALFEGMKF